jgi:cysteinyl-tRNA synthetase
MKRFSRSLNFCDFRRFYSVSPLRIFNSLSKSVSNLKDEPTITWYACGPTVYDEAHIGHARTYVSLDILRRIVAFLTRKPILFAMNITDIDDKILRRASELGEQPLALARRYEKAFFEDMAALGVQPPTTSPRVSEHIGPIISYIQTIESRGLAYKATDGSGVYMDTRALAARGYRYGKLAPRSIEDAAAAEASDQVVSDVDGNGNESSSSVSTSLIAKRNSRDFALWKVIGKNNDMTSSWESPWGRGRPGWHIECSAMAHNCLGQSISIHAGGADLAFPHHCNEIAQAQAYYALSPEVEWVGHWLHTGHVHIQGRKMSKSLKNFITVKEMLKSHSSSASSSIGSYVSSAADDFRMFCLQHHYSSNLTYSTNSITDASNVLRKLRVPLHNAAHTLTLLNLRGAGDAELRSSMWKESDRSFAANVSKSLTEVTERCSDDFDTPGALRCLLSISSALTKYMVSGQQNGKEGVDPGLLLWGAKALASQLESFGFSCASIHLDELKAVEKKESRESLQKDVVVSINVNPAAIQPETSLKLQRLTALVSSLRQGVREEAVNLSKEAKRVMSSNSEIASTSMMDRCDHKEEDSYQLSLRKLSDSVNASSIRMLTMCDAARAELQELQGGGGGDKKV